MQERYYNGRLKNQLIFCLVCLYIREILQASQEKSMGLDSKTGTNGHIYEQKRYCE